MKLLGVKTLVFVIALELWIIALQVSNLGNFGQVELVKTILQSDLLLQKAGKFCHNLSEMDQN